MKHEHGGPYLVAVVTAIVAIAGCSAVAQDELDRLREALNQPVEAHGYGLRVPEDDPRLKAIGRLTEIGSEEAAAALEQFLTTHGGNYQLKQHALVALGRIGTQAAVEAIGRFEEWAKRRFLEPPPFSFGPMDYAIDHFGPTDLQPLARCRDDEGDEWAVFRWRRFGERDFWLTKALGEGEWSEPILIDMSEYWAARRSTEFSLEAEGDTLMLTAKMPFKVAEQAKDTDGDGLSDVVEQRLVTNYEKADTDEDDVQDGEDSNPLTPRHETDDDLTQIRQAVFSVLFATSDSRHAIVVVEKGDFFQQESYGYGGFVLKARHIRDGFVNVIDLTVEMQSPTEAKATISDWEGPLAGSGHEAELKKTHGRWVVTHFQMTGIA